MLDAVCDVWTFLIPANSSICFFVLKILLFDYSPQNIVTSLNIVYCFSPEYCWNKLFKFILRWHQLKQNLQYVRTCIKLIVKCYTKHGDVYNARRSACKAVTTLLKLLSTGIHCIHIVLPGLPDLEANCPAHNFWLLILFVSGNGRRALTYAHVSITNILQKNCKRSFAKTNEFSFTLPTL